MVIAKTAHALHYPFFASLLLFFPPNNWDLKYSYMAAVPTNLGSFCRRLESGLSLKYQGLLGIETKCATGKMIMAALCTRNPKTCRALKSSW